MAGLLDLFTDPLGFKGINKQRAAGDAFARKMYNPNVFNPLTEEARRQSVEGVDDASMRTGALRRLFAGQPQRQASAFGGNQAAMLSANTAMNASLAGAQAGAELDIQTQEEQAKRAGRASLAELFSKQKQTLAIQEAAVEQNKMFAQAEKNRRTNEFIGGVTGLGMDMLSAYASGGISSLFGGGEKAVLDEATQQGILNPAYTETFDEMRDVPMPDITETFDVVKPITESLDNVDAFNRYDFFPVLDENDPDYNAVKSKFDALSDEDLQEFDWHGYLASLSSANISPKGTTNIQYQQQDLQPVTQESLFGEDMSKGYITPEDLGRYGRGVGKVASNVIDATPDVTRSFFEGWNNLSKQGNEKLGWFLFGDGTPRPKVKFQ